MPESSRSSSSLGGSGPKSVTLMSVTLFGPEWSSQGLTCGNDTARDGKSSAIWSRERLGDSGPNRVTLMAGPSRALRAVRKLPGLALKENRRVGAYSCCGSAGSTKASNRQPECAGRRTPAASENVTLSPDPSPSELLPAEEGRVDPGRFCRNPCGPSAGRGKITLPVAAAEGGCGCESVIVGPLHKLLERL